ncbi:hypothetical protein [Campylobacter vicugnae]|uniref:hypothetical protein n=1 Tax=Campylobacter vicugnae TaxID=1660076 RepID=UPI00254C702B|nr:hypothetical protein [Campylobacter ovis]MDL0095010.1 hypothetical protein [Campylobacter ovis]
MKIWLLMIMAIPLWAVNLLTHNIYERDERVDIMLSFDAPYSGTIKQQNSGQITKIILSNLTIKNKINKEIKSNILQNINFSSADNLATLELKSSKPIAIIASKTSDKFGLRIRITPQAKSINKQVTTTPAQTSTPKEQPTSLANIPTKKDSSDDIYTKYIIVILVLFAIFVFSMYIKTKYIKKNLKTKALKPTNQTQTSTITPKTKPFEITTQKVTNSISNSSFNWNLNDESIDVIYEKPLDNQNKVVLLNYENQKYLILVGSSNVLLDKFGEEKIKNKDDFELFFEQNKQKLGSYLQERKNALSSYKDMMDKESI